MTQKITLLLLCCVFLQFAHAQNLADNIDISTSPNGVIALPSTAPSAFTSGGFVKYTKIQAPNGQAIHFVAQNKITDAQIVRARNILQFYLTNVEGSQFGSDKSAVANKMAENNALLLLLNGADGEGASPTINGQPLYEKEMAVEGHTWYINNNYEHRDAAYEEILHMMHDTGIGVDGANTQPGASPAFQTEIRAAQTNALTNKLWGIGSAAWITELTAENSLSQEYLAAVVDSYYGLWGPWTESTTHGMWGLYISKTRAEIETEDPMGFALMPKYFSPFININMDIDPTFNGVFTMTFDAAQAYTHKSQYLQHTTLTGTNASGLKGNDQYNRLNGNGADNTLEGGKGNDRLDGAIGTDVAVFTGNFADYIISIQNGQTIISDNTADRNGVDTLLNIETLRFADGDKANSVTTSLQNVVSSQVFELSPNPAQDYIQIKWMDSNPIKSGTIQLVDATGKITKVQSFETAINGLNIDVSNLSTGLYILQVLGTKQVSSLKVMIK